MLSSEMPVTTSVSPSEATKVIVPFCSICVVKSVADANQIRILTRYRLVNLGNFLKILFYSNFR